MLKNFKYIFIFIINWIKLLTLDIKKLNYRWNKYSNWIGYSSFFYLLPSLIIKGNSKLSYIWRIIWIYKAIIVYLSNYKYSNINNIVHGINRWLATLLII